MNKSVKAALLSATTAAFLLAISIFVSLPGNVVLSGGVDSKFQRATITIAPQSWPFFTKPPSDPELTSYQIVDNQIDSASVFPNVDASNLFGLSRTQRAQGPELANLAVVIPESNWTVCAEVVDEDCLIHAASLEPIAVKHDYPHPSLCGDIILVESEPVRFFDRDAYEGWRVDLRSVYLRVTC